MNPCGYGVIHLATGGERRLGRARKLKRGDYPRAVPEPGRIRATAVPATGGGGLRGAAECSASFSGWWGYRGGCGWPGEDPGRAWPGLWVERPHLDAGRRRPGEKRRFRRCERGRAAAGFAIGWGKSTRSSADRKVGWQRLADSSAPGTLPECEFCMLFSLSILRGGGLPECCRSWRASWWRQGRSAGWLR
jgi:hypothetical protein